MSNSNTSVPSSQRPDDDEEARLRERLKAKLEHRRDNERMDRPRSRSSSSHDRRLDRSHQRPTDYYRRRPPDRRSPGYDRRRPYYRGGARRRDERRSRSRSRSRGFSDEERRNYRHSRSRSRSVSSHSDASSSSSSAATSSVESNTNQDEQVMETFTKDQRTVFVSQLVMRTTEKDLKKFFRNMQIKINEIILLRDKLTGKHKGHAYVELRHMQDVPRAVAASGQPPFFQRFPILIKASEAEKNYLAPTGTATVTAAQMGINVETGPYTGTAGKLIESQKVYVGNLDPSVTAEQLYALFHQFGPLEKVALQMDASTGISKGFCFVHLRDPKDANLAIQTMAGQVMAGRPLKTGWANQIAPSASIEITKSEEFPTDASIKTQRAYHILAQLNLGVPVSTIMGTSKEKAPTTSRPAAGIKHIPTVAEARASLAAPITTLAPVAAPNDDPTKIGRSDQPTTCILVHNMFDKDKETEPGWDEEIRQEFEDEATKYGTVSRVKVMSQEPGGKIYASFAMIEGAQKCASVFAGRWFDKRQLRVEFVDDFSN